MAGPGSIPVPAAPLWRSLNWTSAVKILECSGPHRLRFIRTVCLNWKQINIKDCLMPPNLTKNLYVEEKSKFSVRCRKRRIKKCINIYPQGADSLPPLSPLRVAKSGKIIWMRTPLLPTGNGERFSQTISNLGHAALMALMWTPPINVSAELTRWAPLVNSLPLGQLHFWAL